ncbi:transmembrane protein 47 isoform X4 [Neocloeon triangulifer]|uniref:transmembrane protein 47 isoform X4 n=1 Tax=Neocloeon triangulifer TaxID=2078957 RepID=UPI00286EE047|nr:transmembrane protein 47 isoform X4 [Neocloeon triangulifer]
MFHRDIAAMASTKGSARAAAVSGGFSFEGDSLPDFSEFDSTSVVLDYQNERRPSEGKMAPTTTIETVTITRPLKVIAFICGIIVVMLMVMALASTDWLMAAGWRQGLFMHCISDDAPTPLPFNIVADPDCYPARDVAYIKAAAALCVVCLLTDLFATLMAGLGLRSTDHRKKYTYYRVAVYIMILSLISLLLALVIYPVYFASELKEGNRTVWEFGWAYGVGWGAAIFLFGGVILLLCDKESEEIYYKERKIVHDTDSTRA